MLFANTNVSSSIRKSRLCPVLAKNQESKSAAFIELEVQ